MANGMPTQPGDVLILRGARRFRRYAVGPVRLNRQQDFRDQLDIRHTGNLPEAVATAIGFLATGGQVFLRHIDTGDWSTVSVPRNLRGHDQGRVDVESLSGS